MAILPLQQPPQYVTGAQSPLAAATEGLQLGAGLAQAQLSGEAQQKARQQSAQHQAALQQYMQNPTMQGLLQIAPMLPPEMVKNISEANKMLSEEQRTNALQFGGTVLGFLEAGRTEDAIAVLRDRASAYRNSGDQVNATALDRLVRIAEIDPNAAKAFVGVNMAAMPGGEAFIKGLAGIGGEQRARELQAPAVRTAQAGATTAEATAGVAPEAAAADVEKKMADIDKIRAEIADKQGEIPESARTIVNQSTEEAWTSRNGAQRAGDLAKRFDERWTLGQAGRAFDALRSLIGNTSEIAQLKQQYERELTSQVLANLPPGALSNAEQDQLRKGFPKATDSGESIAAYLRTVQKAYQMREVFADIRGQWAAANGMSGPARRDFTIEGIEVPRGTTFLNFARSYVGLARDRIAAQEAEALARSRSYGRVLEGTGQ
jgi:hypothetical protein